MLHLLFTTFFALSTLLGLAHAGDSSLHQTNRNAVVARSHMDAAQRARLRARQSMPACPNVYRTATNGCCPNLPAGATDEDYADLSCCPPGQLHSSDGGCCDFPDLSNLPDLVGSQPNLRSRSLRKRVPMYTEPGRRTALNAELAAKYLLGAGEFEHGGITYKDPANSPYRSWQQGVLMKGMEMVPSIAPDLFGSLLPKAFASKTGEFALSRNYKAYSDDFPEMLEHAFRLKPDFDAVYFRGIRIDRDMVLGMHKHLPEHHRQRWQDVLAEQKL